MDTLQKVARSWNITGKIVDVAKNIKMQNELQIKDQSGNSYNRVLPL